MLQPNQPNKNGRQDKFYDQSENIDGFELVDESDPVVAALRRTAEILRQKETEAIQKIGKYEITRAISSSSQATTYQGFDPELDRDVLLKMYNCRSNISDKELAIKEGRLLALIQSPYVGSCFGLEWYQDKPVLVLEYVQGNSLADLSTDGEFNYSEIQSIFHKVTSGLCAIHDKGIVHKDFKSSNVMLDTELCPRVIDFGFSFRNENENTVPGSGTVGYLAPEVARGQSSDQRSDVFGLGAVLFELLYHSPPFCGKNRQDSLELAKIGKVEFPSQSSCPQFLVELCRRCLSENPNDRPTSAEVLCELESNNNRSAVWVPLSLVGVVICFVASFLWNPMNQQESPNNREDHAQVVQPKPNDNPTEIDEKYWTKVFESNASAAPLKPDSAANVTVRIARKSADRNNKYLFLNHEPSDIYFSSQSDCYFAVHQVFQNESGETISKKIYPETTAYESYRAVGIPSFCKMKLSREAENGFIVISATSHFLDKAADGSKNSQRWAEQVAFSVLTPSETVDHDLAMLRSTSQRQWDRSIRLIDNDKHRDAIDQLKDCLSTSFSVLEKQLRDEQIPEELLDRHPDFNRVVDCFKKLITLQSHSAKTISDLTKTYRDFSRFFVEFIPGDPRHKVYQVLADQNEKLARLPNVDIEIVKNARLGDVPFNQARNSIDRLLGIENLYSRDLLVQEARSIEPEPKPNEELTENQIKKGREYLDEALRITGELFGKQHPQYAIVLISQSNFESNIAKGKDEQRPIEFLNSQNFLDHAISIFEKQKFKRAYGMDYLRAQVNFGFVGLRLGQLTRDKLPDESQLEAARVMLESALANYQLFGFENQRLLAAIYENLAQVYYHKPSHKKDEEDARRLFKLVVQYNELAARFYKQEGNTDSSYLRASIWACALLFEQELKFGTEDAEIEYALDRLRLIQRNLVSQRKLDANNQAMLLSVRIECLLYLRRLDEAKALLILLQKLSNKTSDETIRGMFETRLQSIRKFDKDFLLPAQLPGDSDIFLIMALSFCDGRWLARFFDPTRNRLALPQRKRKTK